ncbi:MAG: hypothetical protein Q4D29_09205, partial [Lachnospiraceae bacterium]|nr:hypothetical protein [Lachnospiraceae bacterium]
MRSLLTVVSDENLLNRIKLILTDNTIDYYYALDVDKASSIAENNEIATAIIEYESDVVSGDEICELLQAHNPDTQFIMIFNEANTINVLDVYNTLHLNKLMCKEYLVLEDLPSLIESCLHSYNRDEEIDLMDEQFKMMNEKFIQPMQEMSATLNERLSGYEYINRVFRKSLSFVLNYSDITVNTIDNFVDRIVNDYIQIFMIKEPQIGPYFNRVSESFNDPEGRKYFKFICEEDSLPDEHKYNLLFVLDVITIYFDCFYKYYRGKVTVSTING